MVGFLEKGEIYRNVEKYKTEQKNRLFVENETKNKVLKLTWDDNQTFEFNDLENIELK